MQLPETICDDCFVQAERVTMSVSIGESVQWLYCPHNRALASLSLAQRRWSIRSPIEARAWDELRPHLEAIDALLSVWA